MVVFYLLSYWRYRYYELSLLIPYRGFCEVFLLNRLLGFDGASYEPVSFAVLDINLLSVRRAQRSQPWNRKMTRNVHFAEQRYDICHCRD